MSPVIRVRQLYKQRGIVVRLHFVVALGAASSAFVLYHKAFFCVDRHLHGSHQPAAACRTVAGVYVNVLGIKAKRAVIARAVAQRRHFFPEVFADKAAVVFCEKFVFP